MVIKEDVEIIKTIENRKLVRVNNSCGRVENKLNVPIHRNLVVMWYSCRDLCTVCMMQELNDRSKSDLNFTTRHNLPNLKIAEKKLITNV